MVRAHGLWVGWDGLCGRVLCAVDEKAAERHNDACGDLVSDVDGGVACGALLGRERLEHPEVGRLGREAACGRCERAKNEEHGGEAGGFAVGALSRDWAHEAECDP